MNENINNALIIHFSNSISSSIKELIKYKLIKPKHWVVHSKHEEKQVKESFKSTSVYNNYDLAREINSKRYTKSNLSNELLNEIEKSIPILIDMMSRFETNNSFSSTDKLTYIYSQFNYWHNFLISEKINFFIEFDTPHDVYDYIIYILCKYLDIKVIIFQHSSFYYQNKDKVLKRFVVLSPTNNIFKPLNVTKNINHKYRNVFKYRYIRDAYKISNSNLSSAITERQLITLDVKGSISKKVYLFFIKTINILLNKKLFDNYIVNSISNLKNYPNYFKFHLTRFFIHRQTIKLHKFYNTKSVKKINNKKNFIFFPLHYQPERTTCPEGKLFSNQYMMLKFFLSYLDEDTNIYIKEHPKQFQKQTVKNQSYRSEYFYKKLLGLNNVFFLPVNYSISNILKNNSLKAIVTIKGSIILEACLNKIPVFTFGSSIWNNISYVYDLRENIKKYNSKDLNIPKHKKSFYDSINGSFISDGVSIFNNFSQSDQKLFNKYIVNLTLKYYKDHKKN